MIYYKCKITNHKIKFQIDFLLNIDYCIKKIDSLKLFYIYIQLFRFVKVKVKELTKYT